MVVSMAIQPKHLEGKTIDTKLNGTETIKKTVNLFNIRLITLNAWGRTPLVSLKKHKCQGLKK